MATPVTRPPWAVPTAQQVRDAHVLAYQAAVETETWRARGRAAAMDWALGCETLALGDTQFDRPPTRDQVIEVLHMAARLFRNADRPGSRRETAQWAGGIADVLTWLIGGSAQPGFDLPRRRFDGTPTGAGEFYAEREPQPGWGPEERRAARDEAETAAIRNRLLVEAADRAH
jgi:hypothetical protein